LQVKQSSELGPLQVSQSGWHLRHSTRQSSTALPSQYSNRQSEQLAIGLGLLSICPPLPFDGELQRELHFIKQSKGKGEVTVTSGSFCVESFSADRAVCCFGTFFAIRNAL